MGSKQTNAVPFHGTAEQEAQLRAMVEQLKDTKGALMPIMQKAQDIYGYLPIEVQTIISDMTGIPLEKIYGVATFYSQFSLYPKGQYTISVCLGTACYVKGSGEIIEECSKCLNVPVGSTSVDGRYSLEATRCIGACGLAPVMTVNGEVYGRLKKGEAAAILAKFL